MKKTIIVWFTGISGSGKTTIANYLKSELISKDYSVRILDADDIRNTVHKKLGFTKEDITKNNLYLAELAIKYSKKYNFILIPVISPFRDVRKKVRETIGNMFREIYIKCSLEECMKRDTKGLYKKALSKELGNLIGFPGSSVPYEEPENPDLVLYTDNESIEECTKKLYNYLIETIEKLNH